MCSLTEDPASDLRLFLLQAAPAYVQDLDVLFHKPLAVCEQEKYPGIGSFSCSHTLPGATCLRHPQLFDLNYTTFQASVKCLPPLMLNPPVKRRAAPGYTLSWVLRENFCGVSAYPFSMAGAQTGP
jgi:hypothetical protein